MFNRNRKHIPLVTALVALAAGSIGQAHAAAAEAFTTAVTAVTADVGTYGAALVGVAAVGVGFMVGMKYIKKIRGAA